MRPRCNICSNPRAINYKKHGKEYYRKFCSRCMVNSDKKRPLHWERSGYKKKLICDRCGYRAKNPIQLDVYHIDGDLRNCKLTNLKSVCANCQRVFGSLEHSWKTGDLIPDM